MLRNENCLSKSQQAFIDKATVVHGNRYDYSNSKYVKSNIKLIIACPQHGEFTQTPNKHISAKTGCPECAKCVNRTQKQKQKTKNINQFICSMSSAYPQYTITNSNDMISVDCNIHGITNITYRPGNQIQYPCKQCGVQARVEQLTIPVSQYITKANAIHNNKYQYRIINDTLFAVCHTHGLFELTGNKKANHINRMSGCAKCKNQLMHELYAYTNHQFVDKSNKIHHNKYLYHLTKYNNTITNVDIVCKLHGTFSQTPKNHIQGSGCPTCTGSKAEQIMMTQLDLHNIEYKYQKRYPTCINKDTNRMLSYDFHLPKFDVLIEIDGIQHFKPVSFSNTIDTNLALVKTQTNDSTKNHFAEHNHIPLYRIPYTEFDTIPTFVLELQQRYNPQNYRP